MEGLDKKQAEEVIEILQMRQQQIESKQSNSNRKHQ